MQQTKRSMLIIEYTLQSERHLAIAREKHSNRALGIDTTYRMHIELMVYCMRKAIDHFVQAAYFTETGNDITNPPDIVIDSIGELLKHRSNPRISSFYKKIFGPYTHTPLNRDFIRVLNRLSNSYKHQMMLAHSIGFISPDFPCATCIEYPRNDLKRKAVAHNHHAGHLMMGFQDTLDRLLAAYGGKALQGDPLAGLDRS